MSERKSHTGKPPDEGDSKNVEDKKDESKAENVEIISNPSTSTILQWIEDYLQCSPEGSGSRESLNLEQTAGHDNLDFNPTIIPDMETKKRTNRGAKKNRTKQTRKRAASRSSASDSSSDRAEARSRRRTANRRTRKAKNYRGKRGGKRARRR